MLLDSSCVWNIVQIGIWRVLWMVWAHSWSVLVPLCPRHPVLVGINWSWRLHCTPGVRSSFWDFSCVEGLQRNICNIPSQTGCCAQQTSRVPLLPIGSSEFEFLPGPQWGSQIGCQPWSFGSWTLSCGNRQRLLSTTWGGSLLQHWQLLPWWWSTGIRRQWWETWFLTNRRSTPRQTLW